MKPMMISLLALLATACGAAQNSAELASAQGQPKTLVFSRDSRPVDGSLKELTLAQEQGGLWTASLRTAYYDRINGAEVDTTEVLSDRMACRIAAAKILCTRDDRPSDGILTEVAVVKNEGGRFDSTLRTAYFDRINHQAVDETEALASGLNAQTKQTLVYSRDMRPADGTLQELALVKTDAGYDATFRTAYVDRIAGKEVDETETLGSGLSCTFGAAEVRCVRDDRPVDGGLVEVILVKDGQGKFAASLHAAYYDRIHGKLVESTKALAVALNARN